MMPYVMTSKNTAHAYTKFLIDMERARAMVQEPPAELEGTLTLTHLFLRASVIVLDEFPELNRFIAGRRYYQRDGIWLSFSAKKAFTDKAPVVVIKVRFDPTESLAELSRRVTEKLAEGRSDRESFTDKEAGLLLKMPRGVIRAFVGLQRWLDYFDLLPAEMIEKDIFYASAFVANLGSIGLDAVYHHLYEYGDIPLFATIGKIQPTVVPTDAGEVIVRPCCEVKVSFDERIADGFYAAKALKRFKHLMEHPDEL